jgi:hypothetical protein
MAESNLKIIRKTKIKPVRITAFDIAFNTNKCGQGIGDFGKKYNGSHTSPDEDANQKFKGVWPL